MGCQICDEVVMKKNEQWTRRVWGKTVFGGLTAAALSCGERFREPEPSSKEEDLGYRYLHLDVFTDELLSGNQLAVYMAPEGLSADEMQAIALEMSFSETTFIFPAEAADTDARLRIFTLNRELPMAGHPTVGSTFAMAHDGRIEVGREQFVWGLGVGPTPVDLEWSDGKLAFAWMQQLRPEFGPTLEDKQRLAMAFGIERDAVSKTGLPVQVLSCGLPFLLVPMATREHVDAAVVDRQAMEKLLTESGIDPRLFFIFSTEPSNDDATAYSRMITVGGFEDPATGSASGPLGSYLVRYGVVSPEKADRMISIQGVKMRRPSRIYMDIDSEGEEIVRVRVGGESVIVGEGTVRTDQGA
jgi:trans-2,3-dihydro-3-hydroxyanthranilate isomerase